MDFCFKSGLSVFYTLNLTKRKQPHDSFECGVVKKCVLSALFVGKPFEEPLNLVGHRCEAGGEDDDRGDVARVLNDSATEFIHRHCVRGWRQTDAEGQEDGAGHEHYQRDEEVLEIEHLILCGLAAV